MSETIKQIKITVEYEDKKAFLTMTEQPNDGGMETNIKFEPDIKTDQQSVIFHIVNLIIKGLRNG